MTNTVMELHGQNIIACRIESTNNKKFKGFAPAQGSELEPGFQEATVDQINSSLEAAEHAFHVYRQQSTEDRAVFITRIADEIVALGDGLIERAHIETALPKDRLIGERGRTVNQLRMFAELIREG